jgi:hypothetical protein
MFTWLKNIYRFAVAASGSGLSLGTVADWFLKYGPLIAAAIEFVEHQRNEAAAQLSATKLERGFRVAIETHDTTDLEAAVREHIGRDGLQP